MSPELQKKLVKRFPKLYRGINKPMTETCMCWGFACGDGWFNILWMLSLALEDLNEDIEVVQVKEKYGTLRYYIHNGSEEAYKYINAAEAASQSICEECSEWGRLRGNGWYYTACDKHTKKEDLEQENEE